MLQWTLQMENLFVFPFISLFLSDGKDLLIMNKLNLLELTGG